MSPCNKCSGNGKVPRNENVTVKIPKGVDDGTRIRLSGKGEAGSKGGASGDLYLFVSIDNHNILKDLKKIYTTNYQYHLLTQL